MSNWLQPKSIDYKQKYNGLAGFHTGFFAEGRGFSWDVVGIPPPQKKKR